MGWEKNDIPSSMHIPVSCMHMSSYEEWKCSTTDCGDGCAYLWELVLSHSDKILEKIKINLQEERINLAPGFRCFSPWSFGLIASWLLVRQITVPGSMW